MQHGATMHLGWGSCTGLGSEYQLGVSLVGQEQLKL